MTISNKKPTFIAGLVICLGLLGVYCYLSTSSLDDPQPLGQQDKLAQKDSEVNLLEIFVETDSIKDPTQKKAVEKGPGERHYVTMSPADWHIVSEWEMSRGRSLEQSKIYQGYDKDTLLELAQQGDIYALQQASLLKGGGPRRTSLRYNMLTQAAARGSTEALLMIARSLSSSIEHVEIGDFDEEMIRKAYRITDQTISTADSLRRIASAYYLLAGVRGDIYMGHSEYVRFKKKHLNQPVSSEELQHTYAVASSIYHRLSTIREHLGFNEFDNSYPAEYAKFWGYPKQNNLPAELQALGK